MKLGKDTSSPLKISLIRSKLHIDFLLMMKFWGCAVFCYSDLIIRDYILSNSFYVQMWCYIVILKAIFPLFLALAGLEIVVCERSPPQPQCNYRQTRKWSEAMILLAEEGKVTVEFFQKPYFWGRSNKVRRSL